MCSDVTWGGGGDWEHAIGGRADRVRLSHGGTRLVLCMVGGEGGRGGREKVRGGGVGGGRGGKGGDIPLTQYYTHTLTLTHTHTLTLTHSHTHTHTATLGRARGGWSFSLGCQPLE